MGHPPPSARGGRVATGADEGSGYALPGFSHIREFELLRQGRFRTRRAVGGRARLALEPGTATVPSTFDPTPPGTGPIRSGGPEARAP